MQYLIDHWSFDPFLIIVLVLAAWHEVGLAKLAKKSSAEATRERRIRSLRFYGGLAILLIAVESPVEYWADRYFLVHMIQHLLLMFASPVLVVGGAPWEPLREVLPDRLSTTTRPISLIGRFLLRPWVSVIAFNVTMVFWHLPGPFDLSIRNQSVQTWLMHGSFFIAGVLFWLQFVPSLPFRITMTRPAQMAALVITNVEMWILAMSMSILASASWYSVYAHVPGVTLPPFADQQIGAAILWVCGDFWAIPTLVYVVRKLISEDGDVNSAVDRILGRRGSRGYQWAGRQ
ncbi:MAG TPA: cytochrome c oxidase assembly protein [Streptosporangiaceae bacterium]|nr:cytochrome c oxidase assembly protein [Streptosporangiaceae bacterium]